MSAVGPAVADDGPAGAPEKSTAAADEAAHAAPPSRRVFAIDVLACACGGRLRLIATIEDPVVVQRILRHVGLPTETPEPGAARPPPGPAASLPFDFPPEARLALQHRWHAPAPLRSALTTR